MLSIILAIIFGIGFTLVAVQNPSPISLQFFGYSTSIPLYIFAALSFLFGTFISMIFNLFDVITSNAQGHTLESKLNESYRNNKKLQYEVNRLNQENINLKRDIQIKNKELNDSKVNNTRQNIKNTFEKIKHGITPARRAF